MKEIALLLLVGRMSIIMFLSEAINLFVNGSFTYKVLAGLAEGVLRWGRRLSITSEATNYELTVKITS